MNISRHFGWRAKLGLGLTMAALAIPGFVQAAIPAAATTAVAHLVFAPVPIGDAAVTPAGSSISVQVTAEDANHNPLPNTQIWISYNQAIGGGTAFVGSSGLSVKAQPFTTDANGHVIVTYQAPGTYPKSGVDVVHAKNASTRVTATAFAADSFCFSPIGAMAFEPRPMGRKGTLSGNLTIPVTLTVFDGHGNRLANTAADLAFRPATGGGSASVNGVSLTSTPAAFNTNSTGQIVVTYKTPSTVPTAGTDVLTASDAASDACVKARDSYTY